MLLIISKPNIWIRELTRFRSSALACCRRRRLVFTLAVPKTTLNTNNVYMYSNAFGFDWNMILKHRHAPSMRECVRAGKQGLHVQTHRDWFVLSILKKSFFYTSRAFRLICQIIGFERWRSIIWHIKRNALSVCSFVHHKTVFRRALSPSLSLCLPANSINLNFMILSNNVISRKPQTNWHREMFVLPV